MSGSHAGRINSAAEITNRHSFDLLKYTSMDKRRYNIVSSDRLEITGVTHSLLVCPAKGVSQLPPKVSLQTNTASLQSQKLIEEFVESQKAQKTWSSAVLLANGSHLVILLVDQSAMIVQALRIALETEHEIVEALKLLNPGSKAKIECILAAESTFDITSLTSLQEAYGQGEIVLKTYKQAYTYFDYKSGGRGGPITKPTAQQVIFDAKGLCMYEGCGKYLLQDSLTGIKGNFHYLAHIIASSKEGPRGGGGRTHPYSQMLLPTSCYCVINIIVS